MKASLALLLFAYYHLFTALSHGDNEAESLLSMLKLKVTHRTKWNEKAMDPQPDGGVDMVYFNRQYGLKEANKINKLPGQPDGVNFDQYAGYVTVDSQNGRALFYYFVEAPRNSNGKNKPLVLWLNGGPGCSSLGNGAMAELGPFFVKSDGKTLYKNVNAWNNFANMLFLESPAGVGFSYSNTTSDYYKSGDKRTASDSYTFLINWLERFPQYKNTDFFITGESYAGHYIPQLTNLILKNNREKNYTKIKLKGIAIGNAYVDDRDNLKGVYEFLWNHALISKETYDRIKSKCSYDENHPNDDCDEAQASAYTEHGFIDLYNVYKPNCNASKSKKSMQNGLEGGDPCSDNYVNSYLNLPEVQKVFHVNTTNLIEPWISCNYFLRSNWNDSPDSVLLEIRRVIDSKIRVWLYSGDVDSVVPFTATQYSLKALGLPIEKSWSPWYLKGQVGGYSVGYKGLTYATVRGAGHMVPSDQPERALELFKNFLEGKFPSGVSNIVV